MRILFPILLLLLLLFDLNLVNIYAYKEDFSLKYSLISNLKVDLILTKDSYGKSYSFNGTPRFIIDLDFKRYNDTCYYMKYTIIGSINLNIPREILGIPNFIRIFDIFNNPIQYSNSTLVCSIGGATTEVLGSNLTSIIMPLNFTNLDLSYNVNLNYRGITKYKNIPVVDLLFLLNSTIKSSDQIQNLNYTSTIYLSIIDNIPIYINSSLSYMTDLNIKSTFQFIEMEGIKMKIAMDSHLELIQTDYKRIYYEGEINSISFDTNLGISFLILSNSTISDVFVSGDTLYITFPKETSGFVYLLYGKQKLFIDYSKVKVKADNESLSFIPVYFLDYLALSSSYDSKKELEINLGSNVGVYEYHVATNTMTNTAALTQNQLTLFYILLVVIVISIMIIIVMRLKRA